MHNLLRTGILAALLAAPVAVQAQNEGAGAAAGAVTGAIVGGNVGGIAGGLSDASRPRFNQDVETRRVPSNRYTDEIRVGAALPSSGVTFYEVPEKYGVREYRYTVVNHRTALVDPRTRRIVQIVE